MQDFSEQNPMVVDNKKYRFYCQLKRYVPASGLCLPEQGSKSLQLAYLLRLDVAAF